MSEKIFQLYQASPGVKVLGKNILEFINCVKGSESSKLRILAECNIVNPTEKEWYPEQDWLNAIKKIAEANSPVTLKLIAKAIIKKSPFPEKITMKQAFESIDVAYHYNNKNGDIGYYKLVSYDESAKKVVMETNHPYPPEFDAGIFIGLIERFASGMGKTLMAIDAKVTWEKNLAGKLIYTITW